MRRILAFGMACMLLCLCACGKTADNKDKKVEDTVQTTSSVGKETVTTTASTTGTTGSANGNDVIRFNKPKDGQHVSSSLVTPTTVDKETFAADYDIRWKGMFDDASYQSEYTLYHYTENAGRQGLCYGLIRVSKGEESAMVMYVSTGGYAGDVAYPDADTVPSKIRGQQVYLVDVSASKTPSMYAMFRWGRSYITCRIYDCETEDLVNFVRSILDNTPRK